MSILPDHELSGLVKNGFIYVKNGSQIDLEKQLGPSSLDLRLGYHFKILNRRKVRLIDTRRMDEYMENILLEEHTREDGIVIHPGEFILGTTLETVKIPAELAARLEGRSSYGRLGLIIHATAGFVDPGFEGQLTLEIQNIGSTPIKIYPEDRICQIVFQKMNTRPSILYGKKMDNKYFRQEKVVESRIDSEIRED